MESFLALWGKVTGLAPEPGSTAMVQVSMEQYIQLWGHMAEEQASQWRFFAWVAKEGKNVKWEGITPVEGMDYLSDEDKKELLSTEESLKLYDWSSFQKRPTTASVDGERFAESRL
jgi:hypothetical protein